MSNRIELLAILLSGFFPAKRRARTQIRSDSAVGDVIRIGLGEPVHPIERPTLRLLRLMGRHRERQTLS
jgi:hypothetical protein